MTRVFLLAAFFASTAQLPSQRMADGMQWMTRNLSWEAPGSYCYGDDAANCARYGRLYTWVAAQRACAALGAGWRLPSDAEWRRLAKAYGGVSADAEDQGKGAYAALMRGGATGFDAVLGGNREGTGGYARGEAHGFYWTATEDTAGVIYYNFAGGGRALHRQDGGDRARAFAVRCVRE